MPQDEFDADDPLEFEAMSFPGDPRAMARALVEEYALGGSSPDRILSLFKSPFYRGVHALYRSLGEAAIRTEIRTVFGREVGS